MHRRTFLRLMAAVGGAAAAAPALDAWRSPRAIAQTTAPQTVEDLADQLGYDLGAMFDAVAAVGYDPYPGALRGATGTLRSGRGNSVDQALLLAGLLDAALYEYRYVIGSVDDATAEAQRAARPTDPATARAATSAVVLPPDVAAAWQGGRAWTRDDAVDRVFSESADWVATTTDLLADALAGAGIPLASPTAGLDDRADHVWLQVRSGTDWIDLDPSAPGATMGTAVGTPRETLDALPDELFHTLEVRVAAEVVQGGVPTRTVPVRTTTRVADLAGGTPIHVSHGPAAFLDIAGALLGEQRYVPAIIMGDRLTEGEQVWLSSGGGVLDALGGPSDPEGQTLAEWLEIETAGPGRDPSVSTRQLFDRITPERRASGDLGLDDLPVVEVTHVDDEVGDVFLPFAVTHLVGVTGQTLPWELFDTGQDSFEFEDLAAQGAFALDHLRDLLELQLAEPLGATSWVDRPLVTWLSLTPRTGGEGIVDTRVDMLDHDRRPGVLAGTDAGRAGILAGVIDHAAERLMAAGGRTFVAPDSVVPEVSTGRVFDVAMADGLQPLVLLPGTTSSIEGLSAETSARIDAALAAGRAVVIPPRPVDLDGTPRIGWWEYDPATGRTLDRLDDGGGAELTEQQLLLIRIATMASCGFAVLGSIAFLAKAAQGKLNSFTDFTDGLSSAGGGIAGCAAGGFAL